MEFAIATIQFWQGHGFDCLEWRKSVDGTKALVHLEYALMLIPDARNLEEVQVYNTPSATFSELINASEWTSVEVMS